uniref:Uncharacterized protein n=1 Tax=Anguilla anguilla TaxID=7936 RepID=A0A0E9TJI5_ANGAN
MKIPKLKRFYVQLSVLLDIFLLHLAFNQERHSFQLCAQVVKLAQEDIFSFSENKTYCHKT